MQTQQFQKVHYKTEQAAEYLGISTSNMEKMRMKGNGPTHAKLGRLVLYAASDLDAWVSARKRSATYEMS